MGVPESAGVGVRARRGKWPTWALGWATALLLATPVAVAAQGSTHAVIVVGLGGSAEYREEFHAYGMSLYTALTQRHGLPTENVTLLAEREDLAPDAFAARSTRANILKTLGELASRADPQDRILIVLIGHGTAQGDEARFNLPGPDLGPEDFMAGLVAFPTQTLALIHTGSASGGFLAPLSGPNRVIVTATRTARERNATEFPRFFVEAVTGDGADVDKDGRISLLETYVYARREVERYYEEENELLTEHAILDDNGDGEGSSEATAAGPDGRLAATFLLGSEPTASVETSDDPVLAQLYEDRREIQGRIDNLQTIRESLEQAEYDSRLEDLLVELALKAREIRVREGGGA